LNFSNLLSVFKAITGKPIAVSQHYLYIFVAGNRRRFNFSMPIGHSILSLWTTHSLKGALSRHVMHFTFKTPQE